MGFLKNVKKFSIIAIIVSAVIGILFLVFPGQCIKYISLAFGIALIVMGAGGIIGYLTNKNNGFTLALGIISALAGIIICVRYQAIISVIVVLLGIFILATGLFNLFTGIKIVASSLVSGWVTLVMSVTEVIFGIIAITKSTQLTESIVQFLGVALILYAVIDLIAFIQVKKAYNNTMNVINSSGDIEVDAVEIEDVDE